MKLDNTTKTKVEGSDDFNQHDFRVSDANSAHIFKMLTSYSDPIGSVVREITSNCFDAHRKADVDRDVVVRMNRGSKLNGTDAQIQFEDFGTGMPPEMVKEVFTVLGESTKRGTNEDIGAFGIGAKSPFGYIRDNDLGGFSVDTYVDGTHWEYFLAESTEGPQMTEMLEEDTDRTNGTIVTVPIQKGDYYDFKRAIEKELAYFDNIDFQVQNISSDYTIYRGENFIYRPDNSPYDELHACFGKVAYPLDYDKLEWDSGGYYSSSKVNAPIGLYFEIGEIDVVPNREQINYTDDTIEAIERRLEKAQEEFEEMWENEHTGITSVEDLLEARENADKDAITVQGVDIPFCNKLLEDPDIQMDNFDLDIPSDIFYKFNVYKSVDKEGYVNSNGSTPHIKNVVQDGFNKEAFFVEDKYSPQINRFIASRYGKDLRQNFYLVKEKPTGKVHGKYIVDDPAEDEWDPDDEDVPQSMSKKKPPLSECKKPEIHKARKRYKRNWSFRSGPNPDFKQVSESKLKEVIKFEKKVREYVLDNLEMYDNIEPTEDFKEWEKKKREQKKKQKKKKRENEFPIKILDVKGSGWGKEYKWSMDDMEYDELDNSTMYIYGFQEDSDDLLDIAPIIYSNGNFLEHKKYSDDKPDRQRVAVLKIAMKREYLFEDLDNAMHISTFQDGHKIIDRAYHADWIQSQLQISPGGTTWKVMERYYPNVAFKIREMNNFYKTYTKESLPDSEHIGVEVNNKKDFKYTREEIEIANKVITAVKEQLPLLNKLKLRGTTPKELWDEFEIYVDAKNMVHPRLYMKKHNMID